MNEFNRATRVQVRRGDRWIWVLMEPNHPRNRMTFARSVKLAIRAEGDRFDLADRLEPFIEAGLKRFPDDPLAVNLDGSYYLLSDHPDPMKSGKLLVRLGYVEE